MFIFRYRTLSKALRTTAAIIGFALGGAPNLWAGVELKGANGTVVDFTGVREATDKGLHLMVNREQGEIFVLWSAFDL